MSSGVSPDHEELGQVLAEVHLELLHALDQGERHVAGAPPGDLGGPQRHQVVVEPGAQARLHASRRLVSDHGARVLQPAAQRGDARPWPGAATRARRAPRPPPPGPGASRAAPAARCPPPPREVRSGRRRRCASARPRSAPRAYGRCTWGAADRRPAGAARRSPSPHPGALQASRGGPYAHRGAGPRRRDAPGGSRRDPREFQGDCGASGSARPSGRRNWSVPSGSRAT